MITALCQFPLRRQRHPCQQGHQCDHECPSNQQLHLLSIWWALGSHRLGKLLAVMFGTLLAVIIGKLLAVMFRKLLAVIIGKVLAMIGSLLVRLIGRLLAVMFGKLLAMLGKLLAMLGKLLAMIGAIVGVGRLVAHPLLLPLLGGLGKACLAMR